MKKKAVVSGLVVSFLVTFVFLLSAYADTILFPYVPKNLPNVTTLVSVVNKSSGAPFLLYSYSHKDIGAALETGCTLDPPDEIVRPTHQNDLVTFDVAGSFNGGSALFSDPDSYGGTFNNPRPGPHRMTLLVSHSNLGGTLVNVGSNQSLYGEAMILDIAFGASWGYKALNDPNREDDTFTVDTKSALAPEIFIPAPPPGVSIIGGLRTFTFFPPNEWSTRFFVTPLGASLRTLNTKAEVSVVLGAAPFPSGVVKIFGVVDRGGNAVSSAPTSKTVNCVGAIDISDFLDSTADAAIANQGGWGYFYNSGGGADGPAGTDNPVVVFKLDFVVQSGTYGGTLNNAYCLSCEPAQ